MITERGVNIVATPSESLSREVIPDGRLLSPWRFQHIMPLYMDVHRNVDADADAVAGAHKKDLEVQDKHDVNIQRYWIDEDEGAVFCLFEAPNKEAGEAVHREAHGLVADEIYEVQERE